VQSLYGKRARGQSPFAEVEGEYNEVVAWCTGGDKVPDMGSLCIPYWQQKKSAQFLGGTTEWLTYTAWLETQLEELQAKEALAEPDGANASEGSLVPEQPKEAPPKTAYSGYGYGYSKKAQLYEGKYADKFEGSHCVVMGPGGQPIYIHHGSTQGRVKGRPVNQSYDQPME